MAELADAQASGACCSNTVRVQVPFPALPFLKVVQFYNERLRKCRNWQTSKTKDLVLAITCGFKSHLPHEWKWLRNVEKSALLSFLLRKNGLGVGVPGRSETFHISNPIVHVSYWSTLSPISVLISCWIWKWIGFASTCYNLLCKCKKFRGLLNGKGSTLFFAKSV